MLSLFLGRVSFMDYLVNIAKIAPAFLVAISVHEYGHALTACLLGDDTAKRAGRLTLNPLSHVDLMGTLLIFLIGIGWARPVPTDERNFKHPRFFSVLTAFAGPLFNLITALLFLLLVKYLPIFPGDINLYHIIIELFTLVAYINVMLAVFNMVPLPPLDGSHLVRALVPPRWKEYYWMFAQYAMYFWLIFLLIPSTRILLSRAIIFVYGMMHMLVFGL